MGLWRTFGCPSPFELFDQDFTKEAAEDAVQHQGLQRLEAIRFEGWNLDGDQHRPD